jgi:membrane-associated phospholipid phosphatase
MLGEMNPDDAPRVSRWRAAAQLFTRPQPVTLSMAALFSIVPVYLVIGVFVSRSTLHSPEFSWDHALPVQPAWSVVYGSLFLAVFLPVFVVHQQDLIRRTVLAYLFIWLLAFACFLAYPTRAPQHPAVTGDDFASAALRLIYSSDVPYNCLPSLHVAQCVLAALVCYCVHRGVGIVTGIWALLVALSTLFTKQHYVADVLGGGVLAYAAYFAALRDYPRKAIPEVERRLAPTLAFGAFALYGLILAGLWLAYVLDGGSAILGSRPEAPCGDGPAARTVSSSTPSDASFGNGPSSMTHRTPEFARDRRIHGPNSAPQPAAGS